MQIRSRAPLRIGLAGGGTDIESYSNRFGGEVLNASINMHAYCTIIPTDDGIIYIDSSDNNNKIETPSVSRLELDGNNLILHRGVYNRIVKDFNHGIPLSFKMYTSNDAPIGSGLGTSSTMMVALIECFNKWLNLNLSKEKIASLAYDIERNDLKLAGGKQDQYSATYGGINYMYFNKDGSVDVENLNLSEDKISKMESSLLLYYSGKSRSSSKMQLELTKNIISEQIENVKKQSDVTLDAMQNLKEIARQMKDSVKKGNMEGFAKNLRDGWEHKKRTSNIISNVELEKVINLALRSGAEGVKVSGAGGGGFLLLYCNPKNRDKLICAMNELEGRIYPVGISTKGVESYIE